MSDKAMKWAVEGARNIIRPLGESHEATVLTNSYARNFQRAAEPLLAVVRACDRKGFCRLCGGHNRHEMWGGWPCPVPAALASMEVDGV